MSKTTTRGLINAALVALNETMMIVDIDNVRSYLIQALTALDAEQKEKERLEKALQFCRDWAGEFDDGEGSIIHDCTGKNCLICGIEQALAGKERAK